MTIKQIIDYYDSIEPDYRSITKEELNLNNGRNKNIFPYRGQFSPDLIKNLLLRFSSKDHTVLDPFLGCGTTLFETAKLCMQSYGVEINPAAVEMARTVDFVSLTQTEKEKYITEALQVIESLPLFSKETTLLQDANLTKQSILNLIKKKHNQYIHNIFANGYIRLTSNGKNISISNFVWSVKQHISIIRNLPYCTKQIKVFQSDARKIPLPKKSIDLVVTSPPYINVFNYHQHNRTFIDEVCGNALLLAKSEFGANRKNRQNRFLTIVQYILDMHEALIELKRVLKPSGRAIIIIGKSSTVRKITFRNDYILTAIAYFAGCDLVSRQERQFTNQFGQTIFEEILHFKPDGKQSSRSQIINFTQSLLYNGLERTKDSIAEEGLKQAMEYTWQIKPSPIFR